MEKVPRKENAGLGWEPRDRQATGAAGVTVFHYNTTNARRMQYPKSTVEVARFARKMAKRAAARGAYDEAARHLTIFYALRRAMRGNGRAK